MRLSPSAPVLILALFLCTARTAGGEGSESAAGPVQQEGTSPSDQKMEDKLEKLEKAVEALGAKIDALEKSGAEQPAPGSSPTEEQPTSGALAVGVTAQTKEAVRDLWRNIKKGITLDQVEQILGPPELTMQVDAKTVWYYYYENIGGGSVVFRQDGRVMNWQRPPFGWWKLW